MLTQLVEHLEWKEGTKGTIVQAMIYPCILMLAVIGLIVLLLTLLLPKLAAMYEKVRVELPKPTKILIAISDFLVRDWYNPGRWHRRADRGLRRRQRHAQGQARDRRLQAQGPVLRPADPQVPGGAVLPHARHAVRVGSAAAKALGIVAAVLKNSVLARRCAGASSPWRRASR
jgi:hypothetical protein